MLPKITIGVLVSVLAATVQATSFCNLDSCYTPHIACGNNGHFEHDCPNNAEIIDLSSIISEIVDFHNLRRNWIAGGCQEGFVNAERMATMQWDNELASISSYYVKQCSTKLGKCHDTDRFTNVGAINSEMPISGNSTVHDVIIDKLFVWWDGYKRCTMQSINKYERHSQCGYFTMMVIDKSNHIGCAASRYKEYGEPKVLLVCLYSRNNIDGEATYVSGFDSKCKTGTNPVYVNLCSIDEVY